MEVAKRRTMMEGRLRISYVLIPCLVFTLAVAVPLMASAALEKTEEWVARYNSPGNGDDQANAIAVDSSGNVCVTGEGEGDYATVKYDTNGNELWVARYNSPTDGSDEAYDIAVDTSGNIYVTGESYGSGTARDYATVKYDTDGNELWVKRYNGPGNGDDQAFSIAVDTSGNIYVTGRSYGSGTARDYATVKYDTAGNELWVKRYNGPGNGDDQAFSIAVDTSGNIYVTGKSTGSETGYDYATVKYDTNGNDLWVARYNSPADGPDEAYAIAVDTSGNIYVTGGSYGLSETGYDYATVKYDANGNELWVGRYSNSPINDYNEAAAIAVDSSGNAYVTGGSYGGDTTWDDFATVKYDGSAGNELWVKRYNGPGEDYDWAYAIAVDSSGNVYVTGRSYGGDTTWDDFATVKYDSAGNLIWVARYNSPGNGDDQARAIAIDTSGNTYVTGKSDGNGTGYDYATVKYGSAGAVEVTMDLPKGWSMISLPVIPDDASVAALFPDAVVVYGFEMGLGYVRKEIVEVGQGYWILVNEAQSYTLTGGPIDSYTIPVDADGWLMIGGCTGPATASVAPGNIGVIYKFTQAFGYQPVFESEFLERGKGYWILIQDATPGTTISVEKVD
jgi:uncharacterized delta-60 repeat protein